MSAKVANRTRVFSRGRLLRKVQPSQGRNIDKIAANLMRRRNQFAKLFGVNARSTFPQFLQLGDESLRATGEIAVVLPKLLSIAVKHNDGGKPLNLVLLREFQVLLFHLGILRFGAREIEFHQHQIPPSEVFELRLRENLPVEFFAPAAPI